MPVQSTIASPPVLDASSTNPPLHQAAHSRDSQDGKFEGAIGLALFGLPPAASAGSGTSAKGAPPKPASASGKSAKPAPGAQAESSVSSAKSDSASAKKSNQPQAPQAATAGSVPVHGPTGQLPLLIVGRSTLKAPASPVSGEHAKTDASGGKSSHKGFSQVTHHESGGQAPTQTAAQTVASLTTRAWPGAAAQGLADAAPAGAKSKTSAQANGTQAVGSEMEGHPSAPGELGSLPAPSALPVNLPGPSEAVKPAEASGKQASVGRVASPGEAVTFNSVAKGAVEGEPAAFDRTDKSAGSKAASVPKPGWSKQAGAGGFEILHMYLQGEPKSAGAEQSGAGPTAGSGSENAASSSGGQGQAVPNATGQSIASGAPAIASQLQEIITPAAKSRAAYVADRNVTSGPIAQPGGMPVAAGTQGHTGAEAAAPPARPLVDAPSSPHAVNFARLRIDSGSGATTQASVRQQASGVEVRIVTVGEHEAALIGAQMPQLRQTLNDAGVQLNRATVSHQGAQGDGQGSGHDSSQQRRRQAPSGANFSLQEA